MLAIAVHLLMMLMSVSASAFPFPYRWDRFPAAWFGANATAFESEEQMDFIAQFSLAIFGWQSLITESNWTAAPQQQFEQAAKLKARHPNLPVFVYAGFGNADGYDAATWEVIKGASDGCPRHQPCRRVPEPYADWVLQTDTVPVYSMSACEQMGLGYSNPSTDHCWNPIWNLANESMRNYFMEKVLPKYVTTPDIDGVFFDCFNFAYQMPSPWNRHATNIPNCTSAGGPGCEHLLNGTLDLARRIAVALNQANKVPIFSNPASFANPTKAPIWLDEQRLVDALAGTEYMFNYEFFRAEKAESSFQLPNMVRESTLGVPVGVHTYLNNMTEDPGTHLFAFMVLRQEHWYSFTSTGWLDGDWPMSPLFEQLGQCGRPLNNATPGVSPLVYTRRYEYCRFTINCTVPSYCHTDWERV